MLHLSKLRPTSFAKALQRSLTLLAVSSLTTALVLSPKVGNARICTTGEGITLWSGLERGDNELCYSLDWDGVPGQQDRYTLYIPATQFKQAVSKLTVSYKAGKRALDFDKRGGNIATKPGDIIVLVDKGKEPWPLESVSWDKDSNRLEIYPLEPIPASKEVTIILDDVRNPEMGIYYLNCQVEMQGDTNRLLRYCGTWIVDISPN